MIEKNLNELARKRPESFFAALYSLPELRPLFVSVAGEDRAEPWGSRPPAAFQKKIGREAKRDLVTKVAEFLAGLDPDSRGRTMHALASWCDADALIQFAMTKCASHQKKFEALYSAGATRPVFDSLPEARRPSAQAVGDTLTQAERARFHMEALNVIAEMSERGQLAYFSELFGYWSDRPSA
ncbi:MAG: hypothetical protein ABIH26_03635 [Candidatus Eisenbacteria bacterium]